MNSLLSPKQRRTALSSVDLPAFDDLTDDEIDEILNSTDNGGNYYNRGSTTKRPLYHHQKSQSQSITIAKFDPSTPLPMEQRLMTVTMEQQQTYPQNQPTTKTDNVWVSSPTTRSANQHRQQQERLRQQLVKDISHTYLAMKQIRKDLYPKKRMEAAKDLAREAKLLLHLHQSNIIGLRGLVGEPGTVEFGILLQPILVTLGEQNLIWSNRQQSIITKHHKPLITPIVEIFHNIMNSHDNIHKITATATTENNPKTNPNTAAAAEQQHQSSSSSSSSSTLNFEQCTYDSLVLLGERLLALYDIANGMSYLHKHNILYRDLKSENIGNTTTTSTSPPSRDDNKSTNDDNDDGKEKGGTVLIQQVLFDFGLAKECKPIDRIQHSQRPQQTQIHQLNDDIDDYYAVYRMTGLTGTLRVMAPEVIQCLPYGLPADVFSYGVCMWEVFGGVKNESCTAAEICKGDRPALPLLDRSTGAGMPKQMQTLLNQCWAAEPKERPTFQQISKLLQNQLLALEGYVRTKNLRQQQEEQQQHHHHTDAANNGHHGHHSSSTEAVFWKRLEMIQ
jgi:serine/threonine protein kinase